MGPEIAPAPPHPARWNPDQAGSAQAFSPYLRAVRRHWLVAALVTLLTVAVAVFTVVRSGHSYQASASVLVTPIPQSEAAFIGTGVVLDSGEPARTVQTAAALINSADAATTAAGQLGKGWDRARVQSAISVGPLGQSDVLSVTANGATPGEAARVANTFARAAVANRAAVVQRNVQAKLSALQAKLGPGSSSPSAVTQDLAARIDVLRGVKSSGTDPTLSVAQLAQPPTSPTGAPRWLIVLLSLIGGFALASVAALALEFFGRPVRDEDEVTSLYPLPVLASIPKLHHRRDRPLAPWLFKPAAFEQVRLLRVQLGMAVNSPVIMVTSAAAGDGKTTLVAALAAAFAESGQDVIALDLDFRKPSLARILEIPEEDVLAVQEGFADRKRGDPLAGLLTAPRLPNVRLLPLPITDPSTLEETLLGLPALLSEARRAAACVIVDTAPLGEVSEGLRIALMCDTVVFVARPRHTDRRRLITARDLLSRAGAPVAGIVLVGAPTDRGSAGYYGYSQERANGPSRKDPPAPVGGVASARRGRGER